MEEYNNILSLEERLIEQVKRHPVIFNKGNSGYKNTALKSQIWTEIAAKLNTTGLLKKLF